MSDTSKTWLVTGTARGLGRFISEAVLAAGDRLVAGARDPERLVDLVDRYGDRIRPVALDVTDEVAAQHAVDLALNAFGRLDVLVNNAGYGHTTPFEQMTTQDFRDQVETNLFGVVNLTRAVLPLMREQHAGHIFQVSSAGRPHLDARIVCLSGSKMGRRRLQRCLGEGSCSPGHPDMYAGTGGDAHRLGQRSKTRR